MEYLSCGDLASLIFEQNMTESDAKTITRQLLEGLKVMHQKQFCHRDLKPEVCLFHLSPNISSNEEIPQNVLLVSLSPIVIKIADFGISKQFTGDTTLRTVVGTQGYIAPEMMGHLYTHTSVYTTAVDIWSLGCLVHAIFTKETPFLDEKTLEAYLRAWESFPTTRMAAVGATLAAIKFVSKLMIPHAEYRLTAAEALEDLWFKGGGDTVASTGRMTLHCRCGWSALGFKTNDYLDRE